ncbi:hypothetical protein QA646_20790 (plasmid) [Rhizobium sp. CB3090]|uniref:hypothetical protein n=1 Tax=Rhizobium sp. CB3090 TaxID=3039156 RepID=UPI0024B2012F|nr:hypothetical protein [Rhizobium sp. CB3090]WFU12350.1 hypothetical protein QA646_20790 [Rhizobium sp. CB3090]
MDDQRITFCCNVCGFSNDLSTAAIHREMLNCVECGSCARFRGVVKAVQQFVFKDATRPLNIQPPIPNIRGIGMSDWRGYADEFSRICDFQNTYYHMEPFLDVTDAISSTNYTDLDFVVCSEVLEHVLGPVTNSLQNIFGMLKSGGILVLTVPSLEGYETIEHYPHLQSFEIVHTGGLYSIVNRRPDGAIEHYVNPAFHGGPGTVLEMRIFGEGDLLSMLRHVGFDEILDLPANDRECGYLWEGSVESPLWRGRRSKSHVLVCRKPSI